MKIGIQTWGSNGEIRPMLAVAQGLRQVGHNITLAVSSIDNKGYSEICSDLNIRYLQVPGYIDFDMQGFARRTFRMGSLQWLQALLDEAFFPYEPILYETAEQLVRENDCVIGQHFLYPLKLAAIKENKPHFTVTFCHAAIPTPTQAPFRFTDIGKSLNNLS